MDIHCGSLIGGSPSRPSSTSVTAIKASAAPAIPKGTGSRLAPGAWRPTRLKRLKRYIRQDLMSPAMYQIGRDV
jgi:hypothetical protein